MKQAPEQPVVKIKLDEEGITEIAGGIAYFIRGQ